MSFRKLLRHESILAVLLVLALVASSNLSDRFLTIDNLLNQGRMMTEAGIIAVAMTFIIVSGGIDLSVGSILGLSAIVSTTDLLVTLPRHIGETLARIGGLRVFPCPIPIPGFTVRQHWHARYHNDPGNRWLRGICTALFLRQQEGGYSVVGKND